MSIVSVPGRVSIAASRAAAPTILALLVALPGLASDLGAQDVDRLAAACAAGDPELEGPCLDGALAAQAAHGALGLAAAGGADLPGSSSTLGRRFSGKPRIVLAVRGGLARVELPELGSGSATPFRGRTASVPAVEAAAAFGLFNGFSVAPTVGGILSLDLVGTLDHVFLPEERGFQGSSTGIGAGVRLGVFRESFTLPGITLTATRRWMGRTAFGPPGDGDRLRVDLDATLTSVRGTVGKDFLAFGLTAGVGWDRYESDVSLRVRPGGGTGPTGTAGTDAFRSERILFFGGGTYTFLVVQLSVEGGWAHGFDEESRTYGAYDPGAGAGFLRLGLRLTI